MIAIDTEKENKEIARQYKELLRISYQTLTKADKKLIRTAFDTAVDAHKNQRRKTGEAYIFHPIAVAKIVAEQIGLDATSIAAALLHDVVEDTDYTLEDLERLVGTTVARIVHGLTKISHLKKDKDVSLQAENFRKMLLTLHDDVRVIIIKIADRLHNMTTLDGLAEYKQVKIASETLYIYAPLAHRIGLYNVKTTLEDLGFKYTEPEQYEHIKSNVEEDRAFQDAYIESFTTLVHDALDKELSKYEIKGRSKSIFSIHKKMLKQNVPFEQIFDKFAIRIIYDASPAGHRGKMITDLDSLKRLAARIAKTKFQMNTHAIGDAANEAVLNAYTNEVRFLRDPRWRIEHAQVVAPKDFENFSKKIIPSVQPLHATSDMYWAKDRLGSKRESSAYAFAELLDNAGILTLGTDFPVEAVNPFHTFYAAVARKDLEGSPEDGYQAENKISRYNTLMGMTRWAAFANFEEDIKGTIEVGKFADFVILDRDIMEVAERRIPKTRVIATLINGKIVYSNRF